MFDDVICFLRSLLLSENHLKPHLDLENMDLGKCIETGTSEES